MDSTAIYYFSTTGNSLSVSLRLAELLDVPEPISIPGSMVLEDPYATARTAKRVGFVFPVHRATMPEMVRGFIEQMPVREDCYYFAVATYTLIGWNEFWDIDEILSGKGARLNYAGAVRMMGNVGPVQPSEHSMQARMQQADEQLIEIADAVQSNQENYFRRSLKLLGRLVKHFNDSRRRKIVFRIDKHCKRCGICTQVCPAQNIHLGPDDKAPVRSDRCEACLACIHWCPANAVGTMTKLHSHYHHPGITPEQLNPKPKAAKQS